MSTIKAGDRIILRGVVTEVRDALRRFAEVRIDNIGAPGNYWQVPIESVEPEPWAPSVGDRVTCSGGTLGTVAGPAGLATTWTALGGVSPAPPPPPDPQAELLAAVEALLATEPGVPYKRLRRAVAAVRAAS